VNNENITYPNITPPPGEYIVRVDFWSDCDGGEGGLPANYVVTTTVCGESETFQRIVRGGHVGPRRIRGRARDRAVRSELYEARSRQSDVRRLSADCEGAVSRLAHAADPLRPVEVHRDSDDEILGKGDTKQDGTFDISFTNDGEPGYFVVVKAKQDNDFVKQDVENASGEIYSVSSDVIDETAEPDKQDLEIEAKKAAAGRAKRSTFSTPASTARRS
jgi:hypothetical protein